MGLINDGTPFVSTNYNEVGMTRKELSDAVRDHEVRRRFRGVCVDASVPDSRELRIRGIELVAPAHAVICNSSASWVYGVDTYRPSDRFLMTPSFVIPHGLSRIRRNNVACREAYIDPNDIVETDSILITTPVRTCADLMRGLWRPYALAAADGLTRAGLTSAEEVGIYLQRLRKYPRIVQARQLAKFIDPRAESPAESWTRLRLLDAGFSRPDVQIVINDRHGHEIARFDMGYTKKLAAVEYDGTEFHTSAEDRARDQARREFLREKLGWRFAVVGRDAVLGADAALERQVAEWIGEEPLLPRMW